MSNAHALEGIILICLLGAVIYGPWQWACTDFARQHLFHLRDQLFDLARQGKLEFLSPEYRTIRDAFDRQIRFAHVISWVRLVVFARLARRAGSSVNLPRQALEKISDASTRADVKELIDSLDRTMVLLIISKSPVLLFIAFFVLVVLLFFKGLKILPRNSKADFSRTLKEMLRISIWFPAQKFAPLIYDEAATFKQ